MRYTISSVSLALLFVSFLCISCQMSDSDPSSYFAKVDVPTISAKEAVDKGNIAYGRTILSHYEPEDGSEIRYHATRVFALSFTFLSSAYTPEKGIKIFCSTYDSGE